MDKIAKGLIAVAKELTAEIGYKQYIVYKNDRIVKSFKDKRSAVKHAKELTAKGNAAPWAYKVYEMKLVWENKY